MITMKFDPKDLEDVIKCGLVYLNFCTPPAAKDAKIECYRKGKQICAKITFGEKQKKKK